jgi:hypothetical protein
MTGDEYSKRARVVEESLVRSHSQMLRATLRWLQRKDIGVDRELTAGEWAEISGRLRGISVGLRELAEHAIETARVMNGLNNSGPEEDR